MFENAFLENFSGWDGGDDISVIYYDPVFKDSWPGTKRASSVNVDYHKGIVDVYLDDEATQIETFEIGLVVKRKE